MSPQREWLELIRRQVDGAASDEDRKALQEILRCEPECRRLFAHYANIDAALGGGSIALQNREPLGNLRISRFQWRPLTAAAAGLVIGLLGASLVYGFVAQRQVKTLMVFNEGFEDAEMVREKGVPGQIDLWSGDLLAPREAKGEASPAEGLRMVTLPPVEKRKFSYAFRFFDLSKFPVFGPEEVRKLEVTARFRGATPGVRDRFQIRLAAFAEDARGAQAIWRNDLLNEQALIHVAKTVVSEPTDTGWTTLRLAMDVPLRTKVVLVSLAAGVADSEPKTDHYLDDVRIRFIANESSLR